MVRTMTMAQLTKAVGEYFAVRVVVSVGEGELVINIDDDELQLLLLQWLADNPAYMSVSPDSDLASLVRLDGEQSECER